MKKLLSLLIAFIILSCSLYSQAIEYDIKVKYNHETTGTTANIIVTVNGGNPNFTYYLTTNVPFSGDVLMKSESTSKKSFTFKGVKPGKYFVKIEDNRGSPAGRTVEIKENEDSLY